MNNTDRFVSIISGTLLVYIGPNIARTGTFTYGVAGDHFEIHPWVGWFLTAVGVFWLAEGLYSLLGGKRGKGSAKQTTGQDVASEKAPGTELDQSQNNGNDDTTDSRDS